jgi:hypothetical protein
MIAIIPCLAGCETRIIEQAERAIANTEDTSAAAFSISPKVSIEKTVIDAGRLNLTRAPQVLSVPIHKQESTAIEISDVRISCNCLSGRISSKVIEPYGSATLELLLERSKAGPKNAMCTIMCGGHSVSTISVSWIVTADLAMTPDSIADLELGAGQKKEVAIEIDVYDKQNKPSIDVEYKWNLKNNMLLLGVEASTRMVENTCYVSFSVDEKTERQTLSGQLLVRLSGQAEPAGIVPFMITVRTEVNLSPKQLFLTPSVDGSITTQLLIHAEEGETLIPLELFWINGENRSKCNFTKVERDETMIVDVQTNSNEIVGVTELEIVAGKRFVKRIPAFFSSEP